MSPKLRRALRGGEGFKVQRQAWDAVYPDWRWCLRKVSAFGRARWTSADHERIGYLTQALQADAVLARAWYQLLMQRLYRGCPGLGGWFPR